MYTSFNQSHQFKEVGGKPITLRNHDRNVLFWMDTGQVHCKLDLVLRIGVEFVDELQHETHKPRYTLLNLEAFFHAVINSISGSPCIRLMKDFLM